jgi:kynurenine formamidase
MVDKFIDLSHDFEDGMPSFRLRNENGSYTQFTARIRPFLTHQQTLLKYKGECSFEITEMTFQTSIGTYLDSPFHRYPDGKDISQIAIDQVVLPGVMIDVRGKKDFEPTSLECIPKGLRLGGRAVLFNFGWDQYWGTERYHSYPFITREVIEHLIKSRAGLVGVDTINIDDSRDLKRPAHTLLLKNDILIVENLTNLEKLRNRHFRFFAVPIKARKVAAMPVRAFAEMSALH